MFNKQCPGGDCSHEKGQGVDFHHLPISSITATAIPLLDGPKQQSLNFLAPWTRGQFFHGPGDGRKVVLRWFKCMTSIIISVPLQIIGHLILEVGDPWSKGHPHLPPLCSIYALARRLRPKFAKTVFCLFIIQSLTSPLTWNCQQTVQTYLSTIPMMWGTDTKRDFIA